MKKSITIGIIILFIGASVLPSISGEPFSFYANQDIEVSHGTIINDYTYTMESDNQYEGIVERESEDNPPKKRYSYLEHKWTIDVPGGYSSHEFYLEAYHTENTEGDDFMFAYSTDDSIYTDMITVTKISDDDVYQAYTFQEALSGTVYIRVKDLDRTKGNRVLDTIYIDHMYIQADLEPDTTPPVISDVAAIDHDNTWYNMSPNVIGGTLYARMWPTMAYDSSADRSILFGGNVEGYVVNDTWIYNYNDNTWNNASPSIIGGTLYGRDGHAMVYDSSADRTILFSGDIVGWVSYSDTWAYNYNNNTWYNMTPTIIGGTLHGRIFHAMAYDAAADRTILFGGVTESGYQLNDTWVYDYNNNTWYNMTPTIVGGTLYRRVAHAMTYDAAADRTILFGGNSPGPGDCLSDTWIYNYNDNTWYNTNSSYVGGTLPARMWHTLAYDSDADGTILFGGRDNDGWPLSDTWTYNYNDNTWYNDNPTVVGGTLIGRYAHAITYDSSAHRTILFGGSDGWPLSDTWTYNINDPSATITWTTDELSDSVVNYGTTTALGSTESNAAMVTSHSVTLTDLLPETTYYFEVQSTDASENTATDDNNGSYYTFPDTTAPIISNVASTDITDTTATITWTTDEPSDSVVNYGTTTALGNTESDPALVINHEIILSELTENTTYYYEVQSTDEGGYTATDDNGGAYYMFTTLIDAPPIISDVTATDITDSSATITWNTNELSDSRVNYGITTALGSAEYDPAMVTSHSITLTDLLPETIYYYEVQSTDEGGKTATDDNGGAYYTFTTESEPGNVMHVQRIDMWYEKTGINYMIYTKVWIVDSIGDDVEDATVYIETDLPDGGTHTDNGVTGSDGTVTFSYGKTKVTGTYTSTVTNVVKDGWTYDPGANLETSESLDVP